MHLFLNVSVKELPNFTRNEKALRGDANTARWLQ